MLSELGAIVGAVSATNTREISCSYCLDMLEIRNVAVENNNSLNRISSYAFVRTNFLVHGIFLY